jgi:2'-5' RNA ligase
LKAARADNGAMPAGRKHAQEGAMEDFFATVAMLWPAGREDYHWHVLPGSELLRERLCRPYAGLLEREELAPVRPEYMHITIQHLAPVSAITDAGLTDIVNVAQDGCASFAPFAVIAGRAEAWETSVVCPLRPGYLLGQLWHVVTNATRTVAGSRLDIIPAVFHPHMTLAYATGHVEQAEIRAWLADCEATEVAFPVTRLVLVSQKHDGREITFRVVSEIPLTGEEP